MVSAQGTTGALRHKPGRVTGRSRGGGAEAEQAVFLHNIPAHLPPLGQESWLLLNGPQEGPATEASYSIGHC